VLAALLAQNDAAANAAHAIAARSDPDVAKHLLEPWTEPELPDEYVRGEPSESVAAAHALYPALCANPIAPGWLLAKTLSVKPRSARIRRLLESLRPGTDTGPEPFWLEWLLRAQGRPPETLVIAARVAGPRAVPWIVSLLENEDLDRKGAPGSGYGPTSAAELLGALAPPSAIESMAQALACADPESALCDALTRSFQGFGPSVIDPLLAAMNELAPGEESDRARESFAEALASLKSRDGRVLDVIGEVSRRDDGLGVVFYSMAGDPRAIPILSAWVDTQSIDFDDESPVSNMDLFEAFDAIERLGGTLSASQAAKRDRLIDFRRACALELDDTDRRSAPDGGPDDDVGDDGGRENDDTLDDEDDEDHAVGDGGEEADDPSYDEANDDDFLDDAPPPAPYAPGSILRPGGLTSLPLARDNDGAAARKDVGRNAPCPCGSGKKYKKCCWDRDHAAK
jgi:hypothetical protein